MNNTLGIWSNCMNGRVEDKTSNVNTKVGRPTIDELTLQIFQFLKLRFYIIFYILSLYERNHSDAQKEVRIP